MKTVDAIRVQAADIEAACREAERLVVVSDMTGEDWRLALGAVEGAQRTVYQLRKKMLDEALRRNREHKEQQR